MVDRAALDRADFLGIDRESQIWMAYGMFMFQQYSKCATVDDFFGRGFMFGKAAVLCSMFLCDYRAFGWYGVLFTVMVIVLRHPFTQDDNNASVQMMDAVEFEELIEHNRFSNAQWLVHFFATWAPNDFTAVFGQLARRYSSKTLRFAKINIGAYAELAKKYDIDISALGNKDLPTVILFKGGKAVKNHRLPVKQNGKVVQRPVLFAKNVTKFFDLERRSLQ
jgi:Thioredoxin